MSSPTQEDQDELLLSCRYGELEEVQEFVNTFGSAPLADIRDENGNTILHMLCGNGHLELLEFILPLIPPSLLSVSNKSQSTPLHWAAMNSRLDVAQKLVEFPHGPGIDLIDYKNAAGRSPLGEAEMAGWDEGAKWFVEVMRLDDISKENGADVEPGDVEIEIEDADGGVARISLGKGDGIPQSNNG